MRNHHNAALLQKCFFSKEEGGDYTALMRFVQQFCFIMRGINALRSVGLGS